MHIDMIDSRGNHLKTNSLLVLADWLQCLHEAHDSHSQRDPGDYTGYYKENAEVGHWFVHDLGFSINGSQRLNVGDLTFALCYLMSPPPHHLGRLYDPLGRMLLRGYIEDEAPLIRQAYATLVAALFNTRWHCPTTFQWTEHSSLYNELDTEDDAAKLLQLLQKDFPDAHFRIAFYEDRAWLHVGNNIPNTRMYEIRRWLRDDGMLHGYSDDDDDDRHYWQIDSAGASRQTA